MSLLDYYLNSNCVLMEKVRTSDGEGGWVVEWTPGVQFDAAVILDTSMQARIAEKEGVTSVYTVTTRRSTPLAFHDVFKRLPDGAIFRVTGNGADKQSPAVSTLDMCQVTAERWELTT